ncbi:patatin-like phospholipase family protein [Roseivirga sp. BDSF3-8]|uniref:patatin-like phospholipase family protein n=1 Tax=Roseivirga sp. BDSF3-8 TaxID=3241598 RepID=UPI003531D8EC
MALGIALSGGGARAIAHLGILQVLEEHNLQPDRITGSSAGALLGALYAKGYKPKAILDIVTKTSFTKLIRPAMSISGLLKIGTIEPVFLQYFPDNDFSGLKIPLIVAATDVEKGKTVYFSKGQLIPPVLASCCLPVIFSPYTIDGTRYIDGGIMNNLPVEPLEGYCDRIIGLHCNPVNDGFNPKNMRDILEKSLLMAINYNAYQRKKTCDLFLEPPDCKHYKVFDFKKAGELFDIGYNYALSRLDEIKQLDELAS